MDKPVVIVTRHPDYQNEFEVIGGDVQIVDIDLGADFVGQPTEEDQARDWALTKLQEAASLPEAARRRVFDIVAQVVEEHFTPDALAIEFAQFEASPRSAPRRGVKT